MSTPKRYVPMSDDWVVSVATGEQYRVLVDRNGTTWLQLPGDGSVRPAGTAQLRLASLGEVRRASEPKGAW